MSDATNDTFDFSSAISALYIYPIKSCAGVQVQEAIMLDTGLELKGRDAIFSSCQKRSAGLRSRHVITNSFVDVLSHDQARGICYLSLYRLDQKESAKPGPLPLSGPAAVGHYQDSFKLTAEGWKIAHRKLHLAFRDDAQF